MNCEDALLLISGHMDGENTPEEEAQLQAHLSGCAQCREVLAAYTEMDRGIAALTEEAPAGLCASVMSAIGQETAAKKRSRRLWPVAVSAAAVALIIGISGLPALRPAQEAAPMMVQAESETVLYTADSAAVYSRSVAMTDPQAVAEEYGGDVAVARELLPEMELCACETLADGALLYCLPEPHGAEALAERDGLSLDRPANRTAEGSFVLLIP